MNWINWSLESRAGLTPLTICVAAALLVGCQKGAVESIRETHVESGHAWFEDITVKAGLDFVHDPGKLGKFFMPESTGSGAAIFDIDNDGRMDIYLIQNGGPESDSPNRLFRQNASGRFDDVSSGYGLDVRGYRMGAIAGDVNNDGWTDLFLTEYGKVRIFLNSGNGPVFLPHLGVVQVVLWPGQSTGSAAAPPFQSNVLGYGTVSLVLRYVAALEFAQQTIGRENWILRNALAKW